MRIEDEETKTGADLKLEQIYLIINLAVMYTSPAGVSLSVYRTYSLAYTPHGHVIVRPCVKAVELICHAISPLRSPS